MDAAVAAPPVGDVVKIAWASSPWLSALAVLDVLALMACVVAVAGPVVLSTSHMLLGVLLIVYLAALAYRAARHPGNLVEMDTVFLGFFGVYVVLPIGAFVVWQTLGDEPGFVDLVTHFDFHVVVVAILALVAFLWGYSSLVGAAAARLGPRTDGTWNRGEGRAISWTLLVLGAALVGALVWNVGLDTLTESEYARVYEVTAGLGVLAGGVMLIQVGLVVLYLASAERGRRAPIVPLILFVVLALVMLRIGRRRVVLETGLALLAAHHFSVRKVRLRALASAGALALIVFSVVGLARAYLAEGFGGIVGHVVEEFGLVEIVRLMSEPITVLLALTETMYQVPGQESFWLGKTFLDAFEILVPLPIHPSRPLAPSQWFVDLFDPVIAARGGGYSYALLAEGYLNFGVIGVAAVSLLEGIVVRAVVSYRRGAPSSKGRILIYAIAVSLTVQMIRGDFASLLKAGIVSSLIPAVLIAAWLGRRPPAGRRSSPTTA